MLHIVQWSGGIGSWATAELVRAQYPHDPMMLLFADVLIEDRDLYRFNLDAMNHFGIAITRVCEGRTPVELFWDKRFLGNSRIAPCSQTLKQRPCRAWLERHLDPADCLLYVGLEAGEQRRAPGIVANWKPWQVRFPLQQCQPMSKQDLLTWCQNEGLRPPKLYGLGYGHNNCAGVCVRGGQKHWRRTHAVFPDRFEWYSTMERIFRTRLGDVAILKRTRDGVSAPLPLSVLIDDHSTSSVDAIRSEMSERPAILERSWWPWGVGESATQCRDRAVLTARLPHWSTPVGVDTAAR